MTHNSEALLAKVIATTKDIKESSLKSQEAIGSRNFLISSDGITKSRRSHFWKYMF